MRHFSVLNSMVFSFGLLILAFAVLTYLKVPVGTFGDWVGGLLAFFWLVTVVTVPWNIHFKAKAVLADAQPTRERGLAVDERQVAYVRRLVVLSLWIAIGLHLASALVLFLLAKAGVVRVGYVAAVVALLLTVLRPSVSAYEYLAARLHAIGHDWKYPRADVVELRGRVEVIEQAVKTIQTQFDPSLPESLVAIETRHAGEFQSKLANLAADLESLRATNENEHEQIARSAQSAIAQMTTDGQFLDHVREILRFFKTA